MRKEKKNDEEEKNVFRSHIEEQKNKWNQYNNLVFWHDFDDISSIYQNQDTHITFKSIDKDLDQSRMLDQNVLFFTRIDYMKNEILLYQMKNSPCEYIIFADLDVELEKTNFLDSNVFNSKKTIREALNTVGIVLAKKFRYWKNL